MSMSQEMLDKLAWEDFNTHKMILKVWTKAVMDELRTVEGEIREKFYEMIYWSLTEYKRRRITMGLEAQEEEIQGCMALNEVVIRMKEAKWEEKKREIER